MMCGDYIRQAEESRGANIPSSAWWSCTSILWIIPVTLKPDKMPPLHHCQMGHDYATVPIFLRIPVGHPDVVLPHVLLSVAK
jgi:hypothetical protein